MSIAPPEILLKSISTIRFPVFAAHFSAILKSFVADINWDGERLPDVTCPATVLILFGLSENNPDRGSSSGLMTL